jgi:hypothetical protein
VSFKKNVGMLCVAAITLSACGNVRPEVAGMPSDNEWNNTLMTSSPAYSLAGCPVGCMPTEAVWNAVLAEDRKEMKEGAASQQQLDVDLQIAQLLPQANQAIAANNTSKIQAIGAKLEADLNLRMQIIVAIAKNDWRKHSHLVGVPSSLGTVPLGGYGASHGSSTPSPGANCIVVQGQGWTGCAPQQ